MLVNLALSVRADRIDRRNNHNGNARRDEAVFDRGRYPNRPSETRGLWTLELLPVFLQAAPYLAVLKDILDVSDKLASSFVRMFIHRHLARFARQSIGAYT